MTKDIVRLATILLLICGISTAFVSGAYTVTKGIIEARANQQIMEGYQQVLPGAGNIVKQPSADDPLIQEVCQSEQNGVVNGYIYTVVPSGYSGQIVTMIGIEHPAMRISGIKILQQTETPGLGAKAKEPAFTQQFTDKKLADPLIVSKQAAKPQEIQAITASTITSTAVVNGINAARAHYLKHYAKQ